jgi:imidazolonepropionase-like amidohydrolase
MKMKELPGGLKPTAKFTKPSGLNAFSPSGLRKLSRAFQCLGPVLALFTLPAPVLAQQIAIRNVRVLPVKGEAIPDGVVLIEKGKIKAVGSRLAIPSGATVIDGNGGTLMPGLVDANAHFGLRGAASEQASEVTPQIDAKALAAPRSGDYQRALSYGVTSVCLTPGSANVVGGECAVLKTAGGSLRRMLLRDKVAVRAALGLDTSSGNGGFRTGPGDLTSIFLRRPNSRMAAVWELRNALDKADASAALSAVRHGRAPLRISARIENDIRAALAVADEFQLPRLTLDDGCEAYAVGDQLAARHVSVVLGPLTDPQAGAPEGAAATLNTAGILADKGISVAFGSNSNDPAPLLHWAALAVKYGMKPEAALRAVTLTAAEICGVSDRVGSIEVGKDADLVLLSGDPLEIASRVEKVLVNGQVVYREP